ncbi:hypothetical protein L6172_12885 [Thalassospiraceae bacterium SW-3-3]|nr:hypothetical protein L6172_12885 [Thalassospiraceae bacterium SW-3-3]
MSEDAGRIFPLPVAIPPEQAAGFFYPIEAIKIITKKSGTTYPLHLFCNWKATPGRNAPGTEFQYT